MYSGRQKLYPVAIVVRSAETLVGVKLLFLHSFTAFVQLPWAGLGRRLRAVPPSSDDQAVRHQFPEVFNGEAFHIIVFFDAIDLAVAAVARQYEHFGTGGSNLVHFATTVKNAFIVISGGQGTAAATAADLVKLLGVQIHPIFQALIQNPSGLLKKTVAETFLRPASVIAGIMVSGFDFEAPAIQPNAPAFDIINQQIEDGDCPEFFQSLGKPFLQTIPGCQIGVPSFGPEQGINFQTAHVLHNPAGHGLYGVVIAREIAPAGAFPIVRRHGPILTGRVKNFPPVLKILRMRIDQLVVNRGEHTGPLLVDGHLESLESRFLGDLLSHIFQNEDEVFLGQGQIIAGLERRCQPLVQNSRNFILFSH